MKKRNEEKEKPMNTIVLLIGKRLIGAVQREMNLIDAEINQPNKIK